MPSFLYRLGLMSASRPWRVITAWIAIMTATGALALGFGTALDDSFSIPGTESQEGIDTLDTRFPELAGISGQAVFVTTDGSDIRTHAAQIAETMAAVEQLDGVATADNPFDSDSPGPISRDDTAVIATITLDPDIEAVEPSLQDEIAAIAHDASAGVLEMQVGGQVMLKVDLPGGITEIFGVVIALIVLAFMFKALRSAFIPIVTAVTGLAVAMLLMFAGTSLTTISSTAPTLAVMLGLAVGIDYALFIVSRHLDQLRSGVPAVESIARATATSGSAIIFAGATGIVGLVGLFITAIPFLTVMGAVSAIAIAANVAAALTLLPAILGVFGEKIRPRYQRTRTSPSPWAVRISTAGTRALEAWVNLTTSRPLVTIITVLLALGALSIPAKDLELTLPDQGTDPAGTSARMAYDTIADKFGPGHNATIMVTADIINTSDPLGVMDGLSDDIEALDGVESVYLATPNQGADLGVVILRPVEGPSAASTKALVEDLREHAPEWASRYGISDVTVTGSTAVEIDITERLSQAFVPFAIFVVGLSLILLAIMFRSIWVPVKTAVGFIASIGVAFGVTAMVFSYGWGAELLNARITGPVISFLPIIVLGVLFGLAMDYEVFLVSRIREDYARGANAHDAIRSGFVSAAPVVIAAAAIMVVIFASFIPESAFMMQPIALALAVGVFVDAYLVRMTLVPAVLALLGDRAWSFPRWLEKLLPVVDAEGEGLEYALEHREFVSQHFEVVLRANQAVFDPEVARDGARAGLGAIGPLSFHIPPGRILRVRSAREEALRSFFGLASARLAPTGGTFYIRDRHIPGEMQAAQRHVTLVEPAAHLRSVETRGLLVVPSPTWLAHADADTLAQVSASIEQGACLIIPDHAHIPESLTHFEFDVVDLDEHEQEWESSPSIETEAYA